MFRCHFSGSWFSVPARIVRLERANSNFESHVHTSAYLWSTHPLIYLHFPTPRVGRHVQKTCSGITVSKYPPAYNLDATFVYSGTELEGI